MTVARSLPLQDFLAVRHRHRVDVDVAHPRRRVDPLGDLVHVADGRDAGADVEELADPGVGEELHRAAQEGPVGLGHQRGLRHGVHHRPGGRPVGGEVVGAAEVVVVHAGRRWGVSMSMVSGAQSGRCMPYPFCQRRGPRRPVGHPGILPRPRAVRPGLGPGPPARCAVRLQSDRPARPGPRTDAGRPGASSRSELGASGASSRPSRSAVISAWARLAAPSFSYSFEMCVLAVDSLDEQLLGDAGHAHAVGEQPQHLSLPRGQLRAGRGQPALHRLGQVGRGERAAARRRRAGRRPPPRRPGRSSARTRWPRPRGRRRAGRRRRTWSAPRCPWWRWTCAAPGWPPGRCRRAAAGP